MMNYRKLCEKIAPIQTAQVPGVIQQETVRS